MAGNGLAAPVAAWVDRVRDGFGLCGSTAPQRVGVIDVGSNSVRLVVFDGAPRAPEVFFNEKTLCGLGADLARSGRLSEDGKARAARAIERYALLARHMKVREIVAVGTAAIRDAEDGPAFAKQLSATLGAPIRVVEGQEEARLSAQGVLFGEPSAHGVVADMGGASMELAAIAPASPDLDGAAAGRIGLRLTTPLGPLRLAALEPAERAQVIAAALADALAGEGAAALRKPQRLYALGGSWRALARAQMARANYPLMILQGYELSLDAAIEAADWAASLTTAELARLTGVSERRAAVTPQAAAVLAALLRALEPQRLAISAYGLREGVIWERLDPEERAADPLRIAADRIEAERAREPGFGAALWRWLAPTLEATLDLSGERRLVEVVCRLADASWRAHPDYRAAASFELATRGAFGGASHADRVYIGLALMRRHKGGGRATKDTPALSLLGPEARRRAEVVGRAARLGGDLAAGSAAVFQSAHLSADAEEIRLTLEPGAAALASETVEKRLASLAAAVGRRAQIVTG